MPFQFKRLRIPEVLMVEPLGFKDSQGLSPKSTNVLTLERVELKWLSIYVKGLKLMVIGSERNCRPIT
jgi:hypothetical protein